MTEKRFTTNGYYIYDYFKEDKWLVNEVEAEEIVTVMNNLDTKARERSKALGKLQKENEELKKDLEILVHLVDWRDKLEKEWWRCEHFTNPLGVAFCRKNEDFCKRGECEEIYNKIGENE